jgi:hypothetical protein
MSRISERTKKLNGAAALVIIALALWWGGFPQRFVSDFNAGVDARRAENQTTPSSAPPVVKENANSVVSNQPFEQVWSHFILSISKNFFEIDTVDKNSGFLSISFQADPERYVDCGTIHSESPSALWKGVLTPGPQAKAALLEVSEQTIDFPVAKAHQDWRVTAPSMMVQYYSQTVTLNGKLHIVFERLSETSTKVTVNIRYVLNRSVTAQYPPPYPHPTSAQETIAFDSGGQAAFGSNWPKPRTREQAFASVDRKTKRLLAETKRIRAGLGESGVEKRVAEDAKESSERRADDESKVGEGIFFSAGGWVCRPNGKFEHDVLAMIQ